jgi:hypothetical protein
VQQLDELLDEGETPCDAAWAEERGASYRVTAVREGVVFKEGVEEGTNDLDGDFVFFNGPLTELVSSLNKRKLISNSR